MDNDNYRNICSQSRNDADRRKVVRMSDHFVCHKGAGYVPDPYYGGKPDFELALDLIEDGCQGLLEALTKGDGSLRGR